MSGTPQTQTQATVPGSPEYDAQMAQVGAGVSINGAPTEQPQETEGKTQGTEERLFAGKYKTVEELEAAFLAQSTTETKENTEETKPQETQATEEQKQEAQNADAEAAQKTLEGVGLDFNKYTAEFDANGALSEASYKEMADKGVPKEMVDAYIAGQTARQTLFLNEVYSVVGGESEYGQLTKWAAANLSAQEIDAFNRTATQGDLFTAKLAVEGLYQRYVASVGTFKPGIQGSPSNTSSDVFSSTAQLVQAMSDPRYRSDPAYRKEVADKLSRSSLM